MTFLIYCLSVFFFWYLFNCSDIASSCREWVLPRVHDNIAYALGCAFCSTFWLTIAAWIAAPIPASWIFAAPVANLFLVKILDRLNK